MLRRFGLAIVAAALVLGTVPLVAQNQNPLSRIADQWEMGCVACHSSGVMGQTLELVADPSIGIAGDSLPVPGAAAVHSAAAALSHA